MQGILILPEHQKAIEKLYAMDPAKAGDLLQGLVEHFINDEEPVFDDLAIEITYDMIVDSNDRIAAQREQQRDQNRENGMKGGRPKKAEETDQNREKPTETEENRQKAEETDQKRDEAKKPSHTHTHTQSQSLEYEKVYRLFCETAVSLPRVVTLSEARKKAISARLRSGYTVDDFARLFQKAQNSRFLRGGNSRGWVATFDWLIKDANMAKVLEGQYDDRGSVTPAQFQVDMSNEAEWSLDGRSL